MAQRKKILLYILLSVILVLSFIYSCLDFYLTMKYKIEDHIDDLYAIEWIYSAINANIIIVACAFVVNIFFVVIICKNNSKTGLK